ncbi:PREDICTED: dopamine N-acetyltransferase-like [Nicrophorus vespilloides]|uniref:Dopamine N-acetyltransferase-like n=1 Tax=Nicrophorus vespilloides TaxID=110193 RepID=A0ABM1MRK8_NICVS|nr:PREDICTED: dopamine N-acetyltransferase-like [Nicrophorus vespilloides]
MSRLVKNSVRLYSSCLPFQVERAGFYEKDEILDLVRKNLMRDEPLIKSLKVDGRSLEGFCSRLLCDGTVLKVEDHGRIVAVGMCSTRRRGVSSALSEESKRDSEFGKILRLLAKLEVKADVFGKYPELDTYQHGELVAVDTEYRERGLFKLIALKFEQIGIDDGSKLITSVTTGKYSKMGCLRVGWREASTIRYSDYTEDGKVVFEPESPHTEASCMIKVLA